MGRLAMTASAFLLAVSAMSAAGYKSIVLTKTDGSEVKIALSDKLETTVSGDNLVFADNGENVVSVPVTQLASWDFSTQVTTAAINTLSGENGCRVAGNVVTITGLSKGTVVGVVAMNGTTVMQVSADGECTLDLSELAKGVYVVTYNNQTVKIAVR